MKQMFACSYKRNDIEFYTLYIQSGATACLSLEDYQAPMFKNHLKGIFNHENILTLNIHVMVYCYHMLLSVEQLKIQDEFPTISVFQNVNITEKCSPKWSLQILPARMMIFPFELKGCSIHILCYFSPFKYNTLLCQIAIQSLIYTKKFWHNGL